MKKSILFIILSFSIFTAVAQKKIYDGKLNFLKDNPTLYIGHKLYLPPLAEDDQVFGYSGFIIDYTKSDTIESNVYKGFQSSVGYKSKYDDLSNRYYWVESVIPCKTKPSIYYLKLKEDKTSNIIYYTYDSNNESTFPFFTVKYIARIKEIYLKKSFVLRGKNWLDYSNFVDDINTDAAVSIKAGSKWTCSNVDFKGKYSELSLILEDAAKAHIYFPISLIDNNTFILKSSTANSYIKKYGEKIGNKIIASEVDLNFSKEMVIAALGKSNSIKKTADGEVWGYETKDITFEKEKVTNIKENE